MTASVALLECREYDRDLILKQLRRLPELTDFPDVAGKRVLVKPNLLSGSAPEKAVTTHPRILAALIQLLQERGAGKIVVGDSPGIGAALPAARKAGLYQICEETGA
ncbi:MAG: DUF362 domain-containing protein, partial [Spirochaetales bacterium]|nr:DUF362 domain-containing protein [Spirochaetales bacterium]